MTNYDILKEYEAHKTPVPSYEELEKLKIDNHSLNAWIKNFQPKYKEMEKENAQLRKFLEEFNALDVAEENEALKTKLSIQCEANEEFRKENQQLNERLLDMMDLLQKSYFYLNAVADGKVKTEHLEQIKTLAVLIDNTIGEKK